MTWVIVFDCKPQMWVLYYQRRCVGRYPTHTELLLAMAALQMLTNGASGWQVIGTGDFTGNGISDVLLQNGGTVVDWIMQNSQY